MREQAAYLLNLLIPGSTSLTKKHITQLKLILDLLSQCNNKQFQSLSDVFPFTRDAVLFNLSFENDNDFEESSCYEEFLGLVSTDQLDLSELVIYFDQFTHYLLQRCPFQVSKFDLSLYSYTQQAVIQEIATRMRLQDAGDELQFINSFDKIFKDTNLKDVYVKQTVQFRHEHFSVLRTFLNNRFHTNDIPSISFLTQFQSSYFPKQSLLEFVEKRTHKSQYFAQLNQQYLQQDMRVLKASLQVIDRLTENQEKLVPQPTVIRDTTEPDIVHKVRPSFSTEQVLLEVTDPDDDNDTSDTFAPQTEEQVAKISFEQRITSLIDGIISESITNKHILIVQLIADMYGSPLLKSLNIELPTPYVIEHQGQSRLDSKLCDIVLGYQNRFQLIQGLHRLRMAIASQNEMQDRNQSLLELAQIDQSQVESLYDYKNESNVLNRVIKSQDQLREIMCKIATKLSIKYDIDNVDMNYHLQQAVRSNTNFIQYLLKNIRQKLIATVPELKFQCNMDSIDSSQLNDFVRSYLCSKHQIRYSIYKDLPIDEDNIISSVLDHLKRPVNSIFHKVDFDNELEYLRNYVITNNYYKQDEHKTTSLDKDRLSGLEKITRNTLLQHRIEQPRTASLKVKSLFSKQPPVFQQIMGYKK